MKDQRKILLESEDLISDSNVDLFINVNLNRNYHFIKEEQFENTFDVAQQFNEERNNSRNFFLYGMLDSVADLGNNPIIDLYKETTPPQTNNVNTFSIQTLDDKNHISLSNGAQLDFVEEIPTENITYEQGNLFGIERKKYSVFLENYSASSQEAVYLFLKGNSDDPDRKEVIPNQIFRQQLVFRNDDGEFIDYGTDTQSVRNDGSRFTVFNDFPFFYGTHWIKKNIEIEKLVRRNVFFERTNIFAIEGNRIELTVSLDEESQFGLEEIDIDIGGNVSSNDYNISQNSLSWSKGEREKTIVVDILEDNQTENTEENLILSLNNPNNLLLGNAQSCNITIFRENINQSVRYNFGSVFNNLISFGEEIELPDVTPFSQSKPSVLRNGAFFENRSEAFYHTDKYVLEIFNEGENTILPVIPGLNSERERFLQGSKKTFVINNQFVNNNNSLHEVSLKIDIDSFSDRPAFIDINGIIYSNIRSPQELREALDNNAPSDRNFDYMLNNDETRIILISKYYYLPVSVKNLQNNSNNEFFIEHLEQPVYIEQDPLQIDLVPNGNGKCNYSFRISKEEPNNTSVDNEFRSLNISNTVFEASTTPKEVFLITEVFNINRPFDINQVDCVDPASITEPNNQKLGQAFIQGALILADLENETQVVRSNFEDNFPSFLSCSMEGNTNNFMGGFQIS